MRRLSFILVLTLLAAPAVAQTVVITGTVKDINGSVYINGSGVVNLIPGNQSLVINNTNPVTTPVPIAGLDSFGHFSIALTNTSLIQPASASPQWQFSFCSNPILTKVPICFTMTPLALTSSQDLSSTIVPQAAILPISGDLVAVNGIALGASHTINFNNTIPAAPPNGLNISWQTSNSGNTDSVSVALVGDGNASHCLTGTGTWGSCSGGGGGTPGGPLNSVQGNLAGSFAGIAGFSFDTPTGINPAQVMTNASGHTTLVTPDWNWVACFSSVTCPSYHLASVPLTVGSNTITLTPVPPGVNGSDTFHYIQVTPQGGDTGPTEWALITGGTAVSGSSSGTISFNAAYVHVASDYLLQSCTQGIQEAANFNLNPGNVVKLIPNTEGTAQSGYTIHCPVYIPNNNTELDGNWATVFNSSFNSGIVMGKAGFGASSSGLSFELHNLDMRPDPTAVAPWNVTITAAITGGSPTATLTIPTCPAGFYANIPDQLLWLNGTYQGNSNTPYGTGEFVITLNGGTCTPGVTNGTVVVQQETPGLVNINAHDAGSSLSNSVGPMIEDTLGSGGHIHDVRFVGDNNTNFVGNGIQINNDQACQIDNINGSMSSVVRDDADFGGSGIFAPGPGSSNAAICRLHNVNFSSGAHCVNWLSGNDLYVDMICQNYSRGGLIMGNRRGGFGTFSVSPETHFEQGSIVLPYGVPVGSPDILLYAPAARPLVNLTQQLSVGTGSDGSPYPTFLSQVGAANGQYYYLVAHNNTFTGCTSGDCLSAPVFIGFASVDDPSVNNVPVTFFAWGTNGTVPAANPTSYDLLRIQATGGAQFGVPWPSLPYSTSNMAVATGISPSAICSVKGVCTITDNVAPASLGSYTPTVDATTFNKRLYPAAVLLPGIVAISGQGTVQTNFVQGPLGMYTGIPTCINAIDFSSPFPVGDFFTHSQGLIQDAIADCPPVYAKPLNLGPMAKCISSSGSCDRYTRGLVTIATSATSVTVSTMQVQPGSVISISEDSSKGAALGVTCNTTVGRTYAVTAVVPNTSFTITSSVAPTVNPACLNFSIN